VWFPVPSLLSIACVLLALAASSAVCLPAAEPLPPDLATRPGEDWPDFLGPRRNSCSAEQGLDFDWPAAGPPLVWETLLGTGYAAPTVSRGRLFHFDRYGGEDRLTCRAAETGRLLWTLASPTRYADLLGYNNGPRCSPVVDDERVYTFSAEGLLQCVAVETGRRLWEVDTQARFHVVRNFFGVGSTPLVHGDHLIVNVGGSPPGGPPDIYTARGRIRGNGTGVVAFDKRTGEVVWQASDELASYASPVAAEIGGRPWCFVFARGGLLGLDPRSGKLDFEVPWRADLLESVNAATPVVVGDEVFISETYGVGSGLFRVRPGGCEPVWKDEPRRRDQALQLHWNTPVHEGGFLYGSSGRHAANAELRCIEWATGRVRWSRPALGRSSLLLADGHLICLSENGSLHLLRATPEACELVRSVVLEDATGAALLAPPAWAAPALARGLLYLRGDDRLVCLDLRAGPPAGR
jgi:outer membrane protein assembly factor BamB